MLLKKNKAEFLNCNLAGFGHTEGYKVLDGMRPGDKLFMQREDENKYDHEAIALFYVSKQQLPEGTESFELTVGKRQKKVEAVHVGYIPASSNKQLAMFLDYGYSEDFECVITSVDKEAHPNQQIQIRVNLLRKQ